MPGILNILQFQFLAFSAPIRRLRDLVASMTFRIGMRDVSSVSGSGATPHCGGLVGIWTAGQRIDPSSLSTFVWKPMISGAQQQFQMNYTNWHPGQPDNSGGTSEYVNEACTNLWQSYLFNDAVCSDSYCYLCEYEIMI